MKVWIVLEGPDMTYYGTAEIHGVFSTEEAAKAMLDMKRSNAYSSGDIDVEEWEVQNEIPQN